MKVHCSHERRPPITVGEKARDLLDLATLKLPPDPRIIGIEAEEYVDWTGDDSLLIVLILDESTDIYHFNGKALIEIKRTIRDELLRHGITEFPYIRFMKLSERAELEAEEEE